MKYYYLIIFITSFFTVHSQDIILKTNGSSIEAKIDEIGIDNIKYHKHNNLSGPVFIISKSDVSQITFENGDVEVIVSQNKSELEDVKKIITENINRYGFERDSGKKAYQASFEGEYLRLVIMNKKGTKGDDGLLYDFSTVYKFAGVDKRKDELAYINIWASICENEKKNKWDKHKLVMRVKGHKNADRIMKALKDLNQQLYLQN